MFPARTALYIDLKTEAVSLRRVYRQRNSLKVFASVFLGFSLIAVFAIGREFVAGTKTRLDLAIAVILACVGLYFVAETFTDYVKITDESISCGSIFQKRSLHVSRIRYRREYEETHEGGDGDTRVYYLELVSYDGESSSIKISKDDFDFDPAFWQWVFRIPER